MGYVLGVDGGGTKSHLAVFGPDGALTGLRAVGPLNHEVMPGSYEQLETELAEAINGTLSGLRLTPEQIGHAALGLAGVDTAKQHQLISGMLSKLLPSFTLCNDAFLGIPAGSPDGSGICAINGTGCTLAAIDCEGDRLQIGGLGAYTDDKGGSGVIGGRALGAAYAALYRGGEPTLLSDYVMDELGITCKSRFLDELSGFIQSGHRAGDFNRLVFKAADQGDSTALGILDEVARNYAGSIEYMLKNMCFPPDKPAHVTLAGSVFVKEKSPLLRDMLRRCTAGLVPDREVRFEPLKAPPVAGAVIMAMRSAGFECVPERVCGQLTGA